MARFISIVLIGLVLSGQDLTAAERIATAESRLLNEGRKQFALAVEHEDLVEPAVQTFEQLGRRVPQLAGRARVYLGALKALKGKHTFWPHQKVARVKAGLEMMDAGLAQSPRDLEALFVYANINYNLPFFFDRKALGRQSYRQIVQLLPQTYGSYDRAFILDMIAYFGENLERPPKEQRVLEKVQKQLLNSIAGENTL